MATTTSSGAVPIISIDPSMSGIMQENWGNINTVNCKVQIDPVLRGYSDLNIGDIHSDAGVSFGGSVSGHATENIGNVSTVCEAVGFTNNCSLILLI